MAVSLPGPPWVDASTIAKVSKNAYTTLMTSKKKAVGESSGNTIVQNRRQGPAPSMAAASMSDLGMDCKPAKKNRKLYEICFQTAAITISAMAWSLLSRLFHSIPRLFRAELTT